MKNLFALLLLGLFTITAFNSCEKAPPMVSSILYEGHLLVGQDIDFSSENRDASTYHWNFGDGTTKEGGYHTHSYNTPGVYTVQLTVSGYGGTHTSTTTVNIKSYPKKVRIKAIKLLDVNLQKNWDSNSGPDIYFNFKEGTHAIGTPLSGNSAIAQDVTASQLPLRWAATPVLELDYDVYKSINFYDDDNGSSELMKSIDFSFHEEIPFESNIISIPKLSLIRTPSVELEVEYVY